MPSTFKLAAVYGAILFSRAFAQDALIGDEKLIAHLQRLPAAIADVEGCADTRRDLETAVGNFVFSLAKEMPGRSGAPTNGIRFLEVPGLAVAEMEVDYQWPSVRGARLKLTRAYNRALTSATPQSIDPMEYRGLIEPLIKYQNYYSALSDPRLARTVANLTRRFETQGRYMRCLMAKSSYDPAAFSTQDRNVLFALDHPEIQTQRAFLRAVGGIDARWTDYFEELLLSQIPNDTAATVIPHLESLVGFVVPIAGRTCALAQRVAAKDPFDAAAFADFIEAATYEAYVYPVRDAIAARAVAIDKKDASGTSNLAYFVENSRAWGEWESSYRKFNPCYRELRANMAFIGAVDAYRAAFELSE